MQAYHPEISSRRRETGRAEPPESRDRGGRETLHSQRIRRRTAAFSLIEIVVALSLVMLLVGLSVGSVSTLSHTRALREPMAKVREFAKKARTLAILEQRPYRVELHPHGVAIFSLVAGSSLASGAGAGAGAVPQGLVDKFEWDADVTLRVKRWRMADFAEPGLPQAWIFERSGLCEPLTVRVDSEFGFVEMSFNALDAHVDDEASEIR